MEAMQAELESEGISPASSGGRNQQRSHIDGRKGEWICVPNGVPHPPAPSTPLSEDANTLRV